MILLLIVTVSVCTAAWLYVRWLGVKNFWAKRGVPHHPPHPFYGSLSFLQKINTAMFMREIYDHFKSPYVGIWLFWRPALVINCPEISRRVLVQDSAEFRNRFLGSDSHDPIGSLNIFTTNEPLWSNVRRRLTPAFTSSKLKGIQSLMNTKANELVQRIAADSKKGRFNYRTAINDFTSDVIGIASFGVKSDATLTGSSAIREVTKDFERYSLMRGIAWTCIFFFPTLVKPLRFSLFPKAATDYFRNVFNIMVKQREAEHSGNFEPRDLLDILIKLKKDTKNSKEITDDVLVAQATIFVQGGFDTSGSQLTFSMYELAYHPEIQEKLYNELKAAKEILGEADFDETTLANLTYLNCVIKESIRKYVPLGWLDRISSNAYKIDDNLTIPANTPVYVNAVGMHYDPNYFPEPTRFNPDRFLPENAANINKFTYIPFGEGPRNCIGQRFGYATVRAGLSKVVLNYELRPFPNTPKPVDVQIEKNGMFIAPGEVLYVDFVPRNK